MDKSSSHTAARFIPAVRLPGEGSLLRRAGDYLDARLGFLFILPVLIIVAYLLIYPVAASLYVSLTDRHLLRRDQAFVGLQNYRHVLADRELWETFLNTAVWTAGSLTFQLSLGLGGALLLNRRMAFLWFWRMLMIVPWAFPPIVIAFAWRWILNDLYGVLNYLLMAARLVDMPLLFLGSRSLAMPTAIGVNTWFGFPFFLLAILAALQAIPASDYEAARIEGANAWQMFHHVIFPRIRFTIGIILVLRTMWVVNSFDFIFLLTGGGPGTATQTLPVFAFFTGWRRYFLGRASAICVILLGVLVVSSWLYFKLFQLSRVAEE